jgi:hypothetical protein
MNELSDFISQAEAARIKQVTPQSISELVKRGRLKSYLIGGRKFLKRTEIEAFQPKSPGPQSKRSGKKAPKHARKTNPKKP